MLEELAAVLDRLGEVDPESLGHGESVVELHRCLARLDAIATRATAAFDAGGTWAGEGARTAAAWVSVRCGIPKATARRRVVVGRQLRHLPVAERAWLAGEVSAAQVGALGAARTSATEAALERDEAMLVDQARRLRADQFARVMAYWCLRADPDGAEVAAEGQFARRRFHLSAGLGGTWVGDLVLDPVSGTVVAEQLRRIEAVLFAADWAEARQRVGEAAVAADVARTPAQRRADALVEMARRAGAVPEGARRPAPLFTVLVGYETFAGPLCELANGLVVTPGRVAPWLSEADVERVVFDAPSRVVDVGVHRRLFDGATRRAVQVAHQECFHPLCDEAAEHCQVDHVEPWAAGGPTVAANGRPACAFHNRGRHRRTGKPPRE